MIFMCMAPNVDTTTGYKDGSQTGKYILAHAHVIVHVVCCVESKDALAIVDGLEKGLGTSHCWQ